MALFSTTLTAITGGQTDLFSGLGARLLNSSLVQGIEADGAGSKIKYISGGANDRATASVLSSSDSAATISGYADDSLLSNQVPLTPLDGSGAVYFNVDSIVFGVEYSSYTLLYVTGFGLTRYEVTETIEEIIELAVQSYVAEYQAVYDSFTTKPSASVAAVDNAMVSDWVDNGTWDESDRIFVLGAHTNNDGEALTNWKSPGTGDAEIVLNGGAMNFTAYEGFQSDDGAYLDLNFTPSVHGSKFTLNDAHMGVYIPNNVAMAAGTNMGCRNGGTVNRTMLYARSGNVFGNFLNTNSTVGTVENEDSRGSFTITREAGSIVNSYKNGIRVMRRAVAASALATVEAYGNAFNDNGSVNGEVTHGASVITIGGALTDTQVKSKDGAIETRMAAVSSNKMQFLADFVSEDLTEVQGYSTDGTYHYCFDTDNIRKRNADWTTNIINTDPFNGQSWTHMGDGHYYNNKLYVAVQTQIAVDNNNDQSIAIYNSSDLSRDSIIDISAQDVNIAGCVVVPGDGDNGIIYVVAYVVAGSDQIYKYDLSDGTYLGAITMSAAIKKMQGIAYLGGVFYISMEETSETHKTATINKVSKDGSTIDPFIVFYDTYEPEGLDGNTAGELRFMKFEGTGFARVNFIKVY